MIAARMVRRPSQFGVVAMTSGNRDGPCGCGDGGTGIPVNGTGKRGGRGGNPDGACGNSVRRDGNRDNVTGSGVGPRGKPAGPSGNVVGRPRNGDGLTGNTHGRGGIAVGGAGILVIVAGNGDKRGGRRDGRGGNGVNLAWKSCGRPILLKKRQKPGFDRPGRLTVGKKRQGRRLDTNFQELNAKTQGKGV